MESATDNLPRAVTEAAAIPTHLSNAIPAYRSCAASTGTTEGGQSQSVSPPASMGICGPRSPSAPRRGQAASRTVAPPGAVTRDRSQGRGHERGTRLTDDGVDAASQELGADCEEQAELQSLTADLVDDLDLSELFSLTAEELGEVQNGAAVGQLSLEGFLAPRGGWGGSETPVRRGIRVGTANGLVVTSLKRSSGSSGSDHHVSQRLAFAADMSNGTRPTPQMLRTAQQIAAAMGYRWPANGYIQTATTSRGYRAQLIYNSSVVPNHRNHVHFGVKKVR